LFSTLQNKLYPDNHFKAFVLFFVLGLLAYANAIFHPFVHDDVVFIPQNPAITSWAIKDIFLTSGHVPGNSSFINQYYRPLLEIVYRLEYACFKDNAFQYHLVNILIHISNGFLFFRILDILQPSRWTFNLLLGVVFLLHPVQTEAVACIAGISNLLFVFFGLLSFWFYLRSYTQGGRLAFYLSLLSFVLALLSKEQAVILPFLILWHHICFPKKDRIVAYRRIFAFGNVLVAYFLLRKMILGTFLTSLFAESQITELILRIKSIPATLLMYGRLLIFPYDLHYYRNTDILQPFWGPLLIFTALLGLLAWLIAKANSDRRPYIIFGVGWFVIALAPMLNIVPLINEYSLILTAEHFLYLPIAGFILALGSFIDEKVLKFSIRVKMIGLIMLLTSLVGLTIYQNQFWRSEVALFERMARFEPYFGRGHILLAKAYYHDKQFKKALLYYTKAFEIMKNYRQKVQDPEVKKIYEGFIKEIYFDAAHCYEGLNQFEKAAQHYALALKLDPHDAAIHNSIGINYMYLQQFSKAVAHFELALQGDSQNLLAMNNLAVCLIQQGEIGRAKKLWENILEIDSMFLPARDNLQGLKSRFVE
jgi:tetratricopeptide (TPR) repeat protein